MNREQIEKIFTYHVPVKSQPERYEQIRAKALDFALLINDYCPESGEKSQAIKTLQQTVMWANAAIAINEYDNPPA